MNLPRLPFFCCYGANGLQNRVKWFRQQLTTVILWELLLSLSLLKVIPDTEYLYPTIRNKFVDIVVVVERYLIIAHVKNKESKKRPFWISLPVKLADRKMSVKKEKNCQCLNYNIVSLGKMAGKIEPFSYWENLPLFWMMLNLLIFRLWIIIFRQGKHLPVQSRQ